MEELDPDWEIQEHLPEESSSKVNWILSKGLGLGKKILISGVVLSSAPLVLPPLVVISALGFAVSVPYGVFLASYVCSEGLMSKLLPRPPPRLSLVDYEMEPQEEEGESEEDYDMFGFNMEKEEEEQLEDVRREVEMRIGMDEENEGLENDRWIKEAIITGINAEQPADDVQGVVLTIDGGEKGIGEPDDKDTLVELTDEVIINSRGEGGIDREELEKETKGLIEKIRDEGKASAVNENELRSKDMLHAGGSKNEAEKVKQIVGNERDVDLPIEAKSSGKKGKKKGKKKDKTEEKGMEKFAKVPEVVEGGNVDVVQRKDLANDIAVEEKTTDKSVVALNKHPTEPPHGTSEEYSQNATITANGTSRISKVPILGSGGRDQQEQEKDPSEEVVTSHKHEEEKIWQQIEAMRTIVGYKAARQASCIEELKALYIFTGVEPPASFKDRLDLKEVNDKLKFLMSVIGVK